MCPIYQNYVLYVPRIVRRSLNHCLINTKIRMSSVKRYKVWQFSEYLLTFSIENMTFSVRKSQSMLRMLLGKNKYFSIMVWDSGRYSKSIRENRCIFVHLIFGIRALRAATASCPIENLVFDVSCKKGFLTLLSWSVIPGFPVRRAIFACGNAKAVTSTQSGNVYRIKSTYYRGSQ